MPVAPARPNQGSQAWLEPANDQAAVKSSSGQTAGTNLQFDPGPAVSKYRALLALAWLPLVLVGAGLAGLEWALQQGAFHPANTAPSLALAPSFLANLGLMSGNGFLLALALTCFAWCRSLNLPNPLASRVIAGPVVAATVASVWLGSVAVRAHEDEVIALAMFIYAPTLAVGLGFLRLSAERLRGPRGVGLMAGAWATLNYVCQLLYLPPSGGEPGPIIFSLSSVPILAAVILWLVTQGRSAEASPALPVS